MNRCKVKKINWKRKKFNENGDDWVAFIGNIKICDLFFIKHTSVWCIAYSKDIDFLTKNMMEGHVHFGKEKFKEAQAEVKKILFCCLSAKNEELNSFLVKHKKKGTI